MEIRKGREWMRYIKEVEERGRRRKEKTRGDKSGRVEYRKGRGEGQSGGKSGV